jgi:hypothetical protein
MAWRQVGKPKTVMVTQALAKEFAGQGSTGILVFDRPLKEWRLAAYERAMKAGEFRPVVWAKCFCKETNGSYRVNGQHTSTVVLRLDPLPELYAILESYEADTLEDVRNLWTTFDWSGSSRSSSDINLSFARLDDTLSRVRPRSIDLIVSALSFWQWGDGYHTKSSQADRAELILEYSEFAIWVEEILRGGETISRSKPISKIAVVSAMFSTWNVSKKAATDFWSAVRDGSTPDVKSADRVLQIYLLENMTKTRYNFRADLRADFVRCLKAWNAWRGNETITVLRYSPTDSLPKVK